MAGTNSLSTDNCIGIEFAPAVLRAHTVCVRVTRPRQRCRAVKFIVVVAIVVFAASVSDIDADCSTRFPHMHSTKSERQIGGSIPWRQKNPRGHLLLLRR